MDRLKITFMSALLFLGVMLVQAQFTGPAISFDDLNHNFGNIKEDGGIVEHTFNFKNAGDQPLIINQVRSSCGCTVPDWSKEPIPPGESGSIKVSFNPKNRPGAFRKSITVQSNAKVNTSILYIVGLVEAAPKTVADEYPMVMGPIRLRSNHLSVMKILKTENKTASLEIINESDQDVQISIPESPDYLSFSVQPETLMPKQKGSISVIYDAAKVNDWGFVSTRVPLYFNGEKVTGSLLTVSGTLEEDFSNLTTEQKANAARMVFTEETFNFGTINQGDKIEHTFSFKNEGKETLIIRKIRTTCGCTASVPSSTEIPGGEEGTLLVSFDSRGKIGKQLQTITLITNDPQKSSQLIRIAGTVESPVK